MEFITKSAEETKKLAAKIIKEISKVNKKRGGALVLVLKGELGAGKTTFAQGLAQALGIKEKILSPTFVIMKRFHVSSFKFQVSNFYHIDCYRLENASDLGGLGIEEILGNPENLVAMEWPERIKEILPPDTVWIKFKHIGRDERKMIVVRFV